MESNNLLQVIAGESAELGLSGTFLESLFEEAVNDKEVIDSRKWVDKNYPRDDLNQISGEPPSPDIDSKFFKTIDRFQVSRIALRNVRKSNPPRNRNVALIIEEEVKNAIEMQAKSRSIERRGSFQNPDFKNAFDFDLFSKRSSASLPRM